MLFKCVWVGLQQACLHAGQNSGLGAGKEPDGYDKYLHNKYSDTPAPAPAPSRFQMPEMPRMPNMPQWRPPSSSGFPGFSPRSEAANTSIGRFPQEQQTEPDRSHFSGTPGAGAGAGAGGPFADTGSSGLRPVQTGRGNVLDPAGYGLGHTPSHQSTGHTPTHQSAARPQAQHQGFPGNPADYGLSGGPPSGYGLNSSSSGNPADYGLSGHPSDHGFDSGGFSGTDLGQHAQQPQSSTRSDLSGYGLGDSGTSREPTRGVDPSHTAASDNVQGNDDDDPFLQSTLAQINPGARARHSAPSNTPPPAQLGALSRDSPSPLEQSMLAPTVPLDTPQSTSKGPEYAIGQHERPTADRGAAEDAAGGEGAGLAPVGVSGRPESRDLNGLNEVRSSAFRWCTICSVVMHM